MPAADKDGNVRGARRRELTNERTDGRDAIGSFHDRCVCSQRS